MFDFGIDTPSQHCIRFRTDSQNGRFTCNSPPEVRGALKVLCILDQGLPCLTLLMESTMKAET